MVSGHVVVHNVIGFCGKGSQQRCFDHASREGHACFFKHHHPLHGHTFLSLPTTTHLATYLLALPARERCCDEVLKGRVEFFADIDSVSPPKDPAAWRAKFEASFAKLLRSMMMEEYDHARVRWTNASRRAKFSHHFSYKGESVWPSTVSQRLFWQRLPLPELDMSVYSRNRCMRTIMSYNPRKGMFPLVHVTEQTHPQEYFIQIDIDDPRGNYAIPSNTETDAKFRNLLQLLSTGRRETRIDCLKVIWSLANCRHEYPDTDFERLAQEFAASASNYDHEWVSANFHKTKPGLGLGALLFYCKEDAQLKHYIPIKLSFQDQFVLTTQMMNLLNELFSEDPVEWVAYRGRERIYVTPKTQAFGKHKLSFGRMKVYENGEPVAITSVNVARITTLRTLFGMYDPKQAERMAGVEETECAAGKFIAEELLAAGYLFKCVDARRRTFWYCDPETNIWTKSEDAAVIRRWISNDFRESHILNYKAYCAQQAALTDEPSWAKRPAFWTRICGMVRSLQNIVRVIADISLDTEFEHEMESEYMRRWYLVAFTNKKLDLRTYTTSDIVPEDRICLTCGYPWSDQTIDTDELQLILEQIQPDPQVRNFMMRLMSTGLEARTLDRCCFFVGPGGSNGKSTLTGLMKSCLNRYAYTMSTCSVLGYSHGGANPSLANMGLRRFLVVPECESENKGVNTSFIKDLTGCSEINARLLYSSKTKTKICPTLVLESNNRPRLQSVDGGVMRRLLQIDFDSRFCANPSGNREFKKDPMLASRIEAHDFRYAMLQLLITAHMEYSAYDFDLHVPRTIQLQSLSYIRDNDRIYNAWLDIFEQAHGAELNGRDVWRIIRGSRWYEATQLRKNFSKKKLFDYLEKSPFLKSSFMRMGPRDGTIRGWREQLAPHFLSN